MADAKWYAIQTYSSHENKVQRLIQRRIEEEAGEPEEKQIREAIVPTQEVVELRNGKRVTVTRRLYPGYVLVHMAYNQRTAHIISNVQGVLKFLGTGADPQPLSEDELSKIFGGEEEQETQEEAAVQIPFTIGQVVEVVDGPFNDFSGTVQEVYHDKGKVKVEVSLFGRPTSLELDYTQLKGY
ncbi:MAG: transcription termination/antitermination factor NusG [Gemmatimonadetes bacterium]|jgi:transcriptional antiterminator NusG|nr:transcription termination/antitermination factor NusG [Gemmatimonadota bacterium]